ncbi:phosphatidylglycerophosphatase A family protein [Rhodovulum sulfidophilum]|uniref:Phosphatidylglycerophosphatase A n=2 Tax=Rhodovulum sulfidophilum TaxID=35806 RepID=A0A0D6B2A0_RHOSU|nr:phosphatidylglycerophosphatase A [Rhodovulum sulfidophilum]MBL3608593.1 phosphatidylglycerophosphatase A [Rhodovulum sulfidophilum]MCE8458919.1 phosphatidylglycerophosphatase A [Rhodovulum sulfidophilum]BAQ69288.1 phosphatidylglycerophosphatase A [Rhodovulum sulfidophilum]
MSLALNIATVFGVGRLRPAPGTWGSLVAMPAFWALDVTGGVVLTALATLAVIPLGIWAVREAAAGAPDPDRSEYVIDEVAGMWIALLPVSFGAAAAGVDATALYPGWIAAFLGFRLFDIWKPGPIGRADRMKTPLGVMLDDVLAGVAAAVVTLALAALSHIFLM